MKWEKSQQKQQLEMITCMILTSSLDRNAKYDAVSIMTYESDKNKV